MRVILLIFLIGPLIGCRQQVKPNYSSIVYGNKNKEVIGKEVELEISQYKSYNALLARVDEIICNDSVPIIKIDKGRKRHIFYIEIPCWNDYDIFDYSQHNVLIIRNDSIEKRFVHPWIIKRYPLDSIVQILNKDIKNNGRDGNWSDSLEKNIIQISVSENKVSDLPKIFNELTYLKYGRDTLNSLNIWLSDYVEPFIPPAPPDK